MLHASGSTCPIVVIASRFAYSTLDIEHMFDRVRVRVAVLVLGTVGTERVAGDGDNRIGGGLRCYPRCVTGTESAHPRTGKGHRTHRSSRVRDDQDRADDAGAASRGRARRVPGRTRLVVPTGSVGSRHSSGASHRRAVFRPGALGPGGRHLARGDSGSLRRGSAGGQGCPTAQTGGAGAQPPGTRRAASGPGRASLRYRPSAVGGTRGALGRSRCRSWPVAATPDHLRGLRKGNAGHDPND